MAFPFSQPIPLKPGLHEQMPGERQLPLPLQYTIPVAVPSDTAPAQTAVSHFFPVKPAMQSHCPGLEHFPRRLQAPSAFVRPWHFAWPQSSPPKSAGQLHLWGDLHVPPFPQPARHCGVAQVGPPQPAAHSHCSLELHLPWPEHAPSLSVLPPHVASSHSFPRQPGRHVHLSGVLQSPCPPQYPELFPKHTAVLQVGPAHPAWHLHFPSP